MDVLFQPTNGRPFSIEVGYFDSVLEIKAKIQKDQGIPISKQTLIFNGNVLNDELNVHSSDILDHSQISLIVAPDPEKHNATTTNTNNLVRASQELSISINPFKQIRLILKMPAGRPAIPLEMDINDSIRRLKERIQEMEGVPVVRLMIQAGGVELHDHQTILDCELFDHAEIDVSVRPSPSTTTSSGSLGNVSSTKKLKIIVLTKCGTRKIPMEVSPSENVGQLRKELQKLNQHLDLDLPQEGYFFIYKQNVMDDDRSLRWHHVGNGDTIEIFNGSISGGT
ncbi:OLC1v1010480C1 [Oldenlandia corymbosa var. corymbosa]|uniref:OLC1v1010480C1 n=1 Tax=Oldenlandia corymbosa var. corymbosa TaxID=529605 RepID=A0AAV1DRF1_OLDCO|nr:OLC1v1010480C1 [Oldenlandia corymbosa var. corymbosa]